jgi:Rieske Fe-S protein
MNRRKFVRRLSSAAAGASCTALLVGCAGLPYVSAAPVDRGIRILRADLDGLDYAFVETASRSSPVFLSRTGTGFAAVSTRCTHRGCTVSPEAGILACPCHGSRFEFDGSLLEGPAPRPLESFQLEEAADHITILVAVQ